MSIPHEMLDPARSTGALAPAIFTLGDPDLLIELLTSSAVGVVLVEARADLRVVYCNDSFERWLPPGRRPALGRSLPDLFVPAARGAIRRSYDEAIRVGQPVQRSLPHPHGRDAAGRASHWSVSHHPVRGAAGRVTHVLSISIDIAEPAGVRARTREAQQRALSAWAAVAERLRGSEPRAFFGHLTRTVAELVGAARAAFWLYDPRTGTISAQPDAFGFSEAELASAAGVVACAPDRPDVISQVVFRDLEVCGDTISVAWKLGERRLGALIVSDSTSAAGFTEEDAWVLQAMATAAALVWEHEQAAGALAEVRAREAAAMRQQIDQATQLEQFKTNFLKLASHELRAPLGVVRGYISMMEDGTFGNAGAEVEPVLPILRAKLDEMNQLINEILETARLEDSAIQLRSGRVDLREVIGDAVHALEPLATSRHRLTTSSPDEPVVVEGDRARLAMIVTNLVHNAIKYSPRGGDIEVRCTRAGDTAKVAVNDHGVGIAEADQGRLFTRFNRILTPDTRDIPGIGLGLYLARDLARRHGGDIEVRSEAGHGSTFTLAVPLAPAAA
jgi:signal transduction histidine kinase